MKPRNVNESNVPSLNQVIFGVVIFVVGVIILIISNLTNWKSGNPWGFTLISIGLPFILWRMYDWLKTLEFFKVRQLMIEAKKHNIDIFKIMPLVKKTEDIDIHKIVSLMKRENFIDINKDRERGLELIKEIMFEWAKGEAGNTLKISGVAMIHIFGNNGILKDLIEGREIINPSEKRLQILLLNPFSMNAIINSIKQSRPFIADSEPISAITEHTLDQHKMGVLYDEFVRVVRNITDLQNNSSNFKVSIECRIYSSTPPNFLLINSRHAFIESLIHIKKKSELRLKGLLPHLVYGEGEIRDGLEVYFDYIWNYDSVRIEDFHNIVEEKNYEINRLFLLYPLQKEIWERQWAGKDARTLSSKFDALYEGYKEIFPKFSPKMILDLGCGDGGGGSLTILKEHLHAKINFIDISKNAIDLLEKNIENEGLENSNTICTVSDMLTFLIHCASDQYYLVHANFSIIYMTKIKTIETYRRIFKTLCPGGIFMLSVWTNNYFKMPIAKHGEEGHRPPHEFTSVPMTENLKILTGGFGSEKRLGEIRRFYRGFEELLEEFKIADEDAVMDLDNINHRSYEMDAILRVWVQKKT